VSCFFLLSTGWLRAASEVAQPRADTHQPFRRDLQEMRRRIVPTHPAAVDAEEPHRLADRCPVETRLLGRENRLLGEDERAVEDMTDSEATGCFGGQ
jgi:hypothetical protein